MKAVATLPTVDDVDFRAYVGPSDRGLAVSLNGNADLNVKSELDRFIAAVHDEALRRHVEEVNVGVRDLEFMNSSCLKSLVWWISSVQDQPPERQYRIVFLSNPDLYWQRRSLNALACLASDLVSVQT